MKKNILYIEDMKECYDKTQKALGSECVLDWKRTSLGAIWQILNRNCEYDAAIFDVNLVYDKAKSDNEQTNEGLFLMKLLREQNSDIPILCVSSNDNHDKALESGANLFMWKKQFWNGAGRQELERILREKHSQ